MESTVNIHLKLKGIVLFPLQFKSFWFLPRCLPGQLIVSAFDIQSFCSDHVRLYSRTYVFVGNNLVYIGAKFNLSLKAVIQKPLMQVFCYEIKQK